MSKTRWHVLILLVIGSVFHVAIAATPSLTVDFGWDGCYRLGRWAPVYVTVGGTPPQNVLLEVSLPHDNVNAMQIHQTVACTPTPATFALYLPLNMGVDDMSVQVLDPRNRFRRLAEWKIDPMDINAARPTITAVNQLVVVCGQGNPRLIEGHLDPRQVSVRTTDPLRLPAVPNGYDSLNALLLNQPDVVHLSVAQQQSMIDWVRAGGWIVMWASADQQPPSSPLIDALPATIGDTTVPAIPPAALKDAGLAERYARMAARVLTPKPGAKPIPLFGGSASAWMAELGMGKLILLPVDPSQFVFDNPTHARDFWTPLLSPAVDLTPPPDSASNPNVFPSYNDPLTQRRGLAAGQIMDILGDIPGAGKFGFAYVVLIMLALMVVVGPVDWFVLKWLGRQPWTWATTSGWIALVTLAAVYIGHLVRSGDLHLNTLRLIDQAGDLTVATADTVAIYAPKTSEYALHVPREGFWHPLTAEAYYYRRNIKREIPFHQDYQGNRPEPNRINVWNLRMLTADTIAPAPPALAARAHVETREGKRYLVGSVRNLADFELRDLIAAAPGGTCTLSASALPAGGSVSFNAVISAPEAPKQPEYTYGPFGAVPKPISGIPMEYDIAAARSLAIEHLISQGDRFCIYARGSSPPSAIDLYPAPDKKRHVDLLRAVFTLEGVSP